MPQETNREGVNLCHLLIVFSIFIYLANIQEILQHQTAVEVLMKRRKNENKLIM